MGFLVLLRLSSALPDHVHRLLSLGPCAPHDTTVSLGRRVLRLWQLDICWLSIYFRPPPSLPRFRHYVYDSSGASCASSPLLRPFWSCPSPPVRKIWPFIWCDGSAGASGLAAVAAGYLLASLPLSRISPHLSLYLIKKWYA